MKGASALEKLAAGGEQAAESGKVDLGKLARHTYVHKNGATTTVEVEESRTNVVYQERVVADTTGMAGMFPEMHWGWALAEEPGGKTRLTPFMHGTAAKPHGVLANRVARWTGLGKKYQEDMAKNVEKLAKGGK